MERAVGAGQELLVGLVMLGAVWIIYRFEFTHWLGFTVGLVSALLAALFAVINKGSPANIIPW